MRKWIVQGLLPLLVGALLLLGLLALGEWMRRDLRGRPRFLLNFTDIDCTPPRPLSRQDFLAEVQYLAEQPDGLSLLDEHLTERLASVFLQHPWVEEVEHIEVQSDRRIQ